MNWRWRWRRRSRRVRRRIRPLRPAFLVAVLILVLCFGWLAFRAYRVRQDLLAARSGISQVEAAARSGDGPAARARLSAVQQRTDDASGATSDPIWRAAGRLPLLGPTVSAVAGVAEVAHGLTTQVLPPLVDTAETLSGRGRRVGTQVDLAPFRRAAGPLAKAAEGLRSSQVRLAALPRARLAAVRDARAELTDRVVRLQSLTTGALAAAQLAPDMLGGAGPRRYFLAIQNNAEARATGGLLGSFGIVSATNGTVDLTMTGANNELINPEGPVADFGPDFERRYGRLFATTDWRSANLTPDFPSAGQIWTSMWAATRRQQLDGAIAVDPVALSYLLEATGPVTLSDGTRLTAASVVDFTLSEVYARFPRVRDSERELYLQSAAEAIFARIEKGGIDTTRLAERLGHAVLTGHLQVYSVRPEEQQALETTRIAGQLPAKSGQPYLQVVTQNSGGNKLDYYLRRSVSYDGRFTGEAVDTGGGPMPEERATVTVTLTNTARPSGLPDYVTLRPDLPRGTPYPKGQNKIFLSVYGGVGATLGGATLDGKPVALQSEIEKGHGVFSTVVVLNPGQSATLVLDLFQPTAGAALVYRQQPLARLDELSIRQG